MVNETVGDMDEEERRYFSKGEKEQTDYGSLCLDVGRQLRDLAAVLEQSASSPEERVLVIRLGYTRAHLLRIVQNLWLVLREAEEAIIPHLSPRDGGDA
jgi:hypothetical protein